MAGVSRRRFLSRGSLTVAAATVMAAAPAGMVPAVLTATEDAPLTEEEIGGAAASADGALVAHVKDLASGEISVFSGTREVVIRDRTIAARIVRALR